MGNARTVIESVGIHQNNLPDDIENVIKAVVLPELRRLGHSVQTATVEYDDHTLLDVNVPAFDAPKTLRTGAKVAGLSFSEALAALRAYVQEWKPGIAPMCAKKIQRAGWNGKGMYVGLRMPDSKTITGHAFIDSDVCKVCGKTGEEIAVNGVPCGNKPSMSLPYLYMKTADDKLVPWLISQTDALADDWCILE